MSKNLVIVESPAKAKTIKKYLGGDFEVMASYGHVRDLVPKEGAVDTEHGFRMRYEVIEKNEKHVNAIARALKKSDSLYLATDPDREGEAISWHLLELLKEKGALDDKPVHRVHFYEITKNAVQEAVDHPAVLSTDLINAQQARRALDYLLGFNLSPLLWRKIRPGLGAGRVQSPALRMIVEREDEIRAFEAREYWTVEVDAEKSEQTFPARLAEYLGEKVEQFSFGDAEQAEDVRRTIEKAANGQLRVAKVSKKQRRRNPAAPFTTSTLQQDASRKLGFSAQKTMSVAQRLYEGVDFGEGPVGLITYMRTDSVNLSAEALNDLRTTIGQNYGTAKLPEEPRRFKTRSKNAQEAHEAIRPAASSIRPADLRGKIDNDQFRLYELVWKRAVASQMIAAIYDTVALDLLPGGDDQHQTVDKDQSQTIRFRANGSVLVEPGFLEVYREGRDDVAEDDSDRRLPQIDEGEILALKDIRAEQHFTEPPPRYSEASLVKALEEFGIGRPSTYASIIQTLKSREYVEMDQKRFRPTDVGRIVNRFLTEHFTQYVDYDFTARMEDNLDAISRGEKDWVPLMEDFWGPFNALVEDKATTVTRSQVSQARIIGVDPESGREVSVRMGRYGPFVQIGTREDEDKPKFAGLRPGQKMDDIELDEALALFQLPRELGETADGEKITVNIGRFGPYVRYANNFVSIREDDPYTIGLERALELIAAKKEADLARILREWPELGIRIMKGRWGPYATDGSRNARLPKDTDPAALTLEEVQELLDKAPVRGSKKKTAKTKVTKKKATKKKTSKKKAAKKKAKKRAASKKTTKKKTGDRKKAAMKTGSKADKGSGDSASAPEKASAGG
jgi:DNA topoisomerase-1